jgi:hypothetical protein
MRIAVHSPYYAFVDQNTNYNGYDFEFLKQFKPALYFPGWRKVHYLKLWKALKSHGINPGDFQWITSLADLNRKADVLVSFCGRPDLPALAPPKAFNGMKVFHVMDYVFRASAACDSLVKGGVDYVMGYASHDRFCAFFQHYYQPYVGKVIPVPFGYGKRFEQLTPFSNRINKVIAAGSVNPVEDPAVPDKEELSEYISFYSHERWTHKWRYQLAHSADDLKDVMESVLPVWPETKNWKYDAVGLMNSYKLFANDEGLMAFPPARTYEGVAAGAVMVCSDHPSYTELGFRDGENCIMHKSGDLNDFREKVSHYLNHNDRLAKIAESGRRMVSERYSHSQIAHDLYQKLQRLYNE